MIWKKVLYIYCVGLRPKVSISISSPIATLFFINQRDAIACFIYFELFQVKFFFYNFKCTHTRRTPMCVFSRMTSVNTPLVELSTLFIIIIFFFVFIHFYWNTQRQRENSFYLFAFCRFALSTVYILYIHICSIYRYISPLRDAIYMRDNFAKR